MSNLRLFRVSLYPSAETWEQWEKEAVYPLSWSWGHLPVAVTLTVAGSDEEQLSRLAQEAGYLPVSVKPASRPTWQERRGFLREKQRLLEFVLLVTAEGGMPVQALDGYRFVPAVGRDVFVAGLLAADLRSGTPPELALARYPAWLPEHVVAGLLGGKARAVGPTEGLAALRLVEERQKFTGHLRRVALYPAYILLAGTYFSFAIQELSWVFKDLLLVTSTPSGIEQWFAWFNSLLSIDSGGEPLLLTMPVLAGAALLGVVGLAWSGVLQPWRREEERDYLLARRVLALYEAEGFSAEALAGFAESASSPGEAVLFRAALGELRAGRPVLEVLRDAEVFGVEVNLAARIGLAGGDFAAALRAGLPGFEERLSDWRVGVRWYGMGAMLVAGVVVGLIVIGQYVRIMSTSAGGW